MAAISRPIQLQPTQHSAPVCADFEDRESVVAFEKAMRTHRAHAEPFELTPLGGRVDGAWRVSGASGAAYVVDIVDGSGMNDACTCPDFLVGELGVCKHLEAVRRGIRARAGLQKAFQRLGAVPDRPTLAVEAKGGLSLKALGVWPSRVLKPEWLVGEEGGAGLSPDSRLLQPGYAETIGARVVHAARPAILVQRTRCDHRRRAFLLRLDEAQRAKNFRTRTAATLKAIPSRFLFVLTGTPIENRLDDLYSLFQILDPGILGPLWRFNLEHHQQGRHGKVLGCKNMGRLRERIAPYLLRRRKEAVLDQLPDLTEQTRYIALTAEQAEFEEGCRAEAARYLAIADRRPLTLQEQKCLQAALLKARQACDALELADPLRGKSASPKLDEFEAFVAEVAAQGTSKILVFSEWVEMLKLAAGRIDKLGIGWTMLTGQVPTEKRGALLDRFRADTSIQVLLSSDAGGVGLNLQVANYVAHLDLPWNPARLDQRTSRAHRLGQTLDRTVLNPPL